MKTYSDEKGWPCHKSVDNKICNHKTCPDTDCQFKEFLENGSKEFNADAAHHAMTGE